MNNNNENVKKFDVDIYKFYDEEGKWIGEDYNFNKGLTFFNNAKWCKYFKNGIFEREFFVNIQL